MAFKEFISVAGLKGNTVELSPTYCLVNAYCFDILGE